MVNKIDKVAFKAVQPVFKIFKMGEYFADVSPPLIHSL